MPRTMLVYGATGFSGGMIAREAARRRDGRAAAEDESAEALEPVNLRLLLGGRDGRGLVELARDLCAGTRVFALDDRRAMDAALQDVDVVINAAGPFAFTAEPLARAALEAGCDYVDINGEVDVYLRLDDYGWLAERLNVAMVCGAAYLGGASNLLLGAALARLREKAREVRDLGNVSIGVKAMPAYTRGSAQSAWRTVREQVSVVRKGERQDQDGKSRPAMVLWHEPVGKIEHAFDFTEGTEKDKRVRGDRLSIATAVNFVDTLAARCTLRNHDVMARSVASYLEAGAFARLGYTMAGMLAPVLAAPLVDGLARAQFELLPATLGAFDMRDDQALTLEVEGPLRQPWIDWTWITPNPYRFTARIAVEVACKLMHQRARMASSTAHAMRDAHLVGWRTPHDVLQLHAKALEQGLFRGCRLVKRQRALAGAAGKA